MPVRMVQSTDIWRRCSAHAGFWVARWVRAGTDWGSDIPRTLARPVASLRQCHRRVRACSGWRPDARLVADMFVVLDRKEVATALACFAVLVGVRELAMAVTTMDGHACGALALLAVVIVAAGDRIAIATTSVDTTV